jgi:hypothetical protein
MVMDEADPEFYGRVMSINMLTFSSMPLMALPLGGLADSIGAPETFMGQGAVVLAFMAFVALVNSGYTFGRHQQRVSEMPVGAPSGVPAQGVAGFAGPGASGGGGGS